MLWEDGKKTESDSVSSERTTGKHKAHLLGLRDKKFHLNTRENLLTLRMIEHWNKLPRNLKESPSLEIFKT